MGRIAKTEDNIVSIPKSVSVTAKGYVYWNATTTWVDKANGTGKRADHKKECIGVILCPGSDWKKDRRMYANPTKLPLRARNTRKGLTAFQWGCMQW